MVIKFNSNKNLSLKSPTNRDTYNREFFKKDILPQSLIKN